MLRATSKEIREKNFVVELILKMSVQSELRKEFHPCFIVGGIQSFKSCSDKARWRESECISSSSNFAISQYLSKKLWKGSSFLNFAYCKTKNPTAISFFSISDLTSSTSYYWSFIKHKRWNILLLIAPCVFLSLRYFVTVCRLRSIIW